MRYEYLISFIISFSLDYVDTFTQMATGRCSIQRYRIFGERRTSQGIQDDIERCQWAVSIGRIDSDYGMNEFIVETNPFTIQLTIRSRSLLGSIGCRKEYTYEHFSRLQVSSIHL